MQKHGKKKILAVVEDLLFTVKISDAAKRAGLDVEFVKSERDVMDKATNEKPLLIILDLNFSAVQPLKLISQSAAEQARNIVGTSFSGWFAFQALYARIVGRSAESVARAFTPGEAGSKPKGNR